MSFFDELGALMKKYNFELHTIQLDENVAKFNEVFKTNVKKEELPPPVLLFRTSEGDFIPTVFGPLSLKNEEQNLHFIDISKPTEIINMFPVEEKKQEVKVEEKKEEVKAEAKQEAPKAADEMEWEETKETKEEERKETSKKSVKKAAPKKVEKKPEPKRVEEVNRKVLIVGPLFKGQNFNIDQYNKFVDVNLGKLSVYNTINTLLSLVIGQKNYAENEPIKANSKRGKQVISDLCEKFVKDFNEIVFMKGSDKALEAKKIREFAETNGIYVIEQKDF